jgi:hypothetical protein
MYISGTLHFYSGEDRELFFVFDDDVAQQLYSDPEFAMDDAASRRAYISVGSERFIHRRTLSFSKKQTEIKISLCSRGTKDELGALTLLYDWYAARGNPRPPPFGVIGSLKRARYQGETVWELHITEPVGLVDPPGLRRRTKEAPAERRSYVHRRYIVERDLAGIGRVAEELALPLVQDDYPLPEYSCLWRQKFLDSERIEIRKMGIIADIDVWNVSRSSPELFVEVKAQKVPLNGAEPAFHLSAGEWRSYQSAVKARVPYRIWLFQYRELRDFKLAPEHVKLIVFEDINKKWINPESYLVTPASSAGMHHPLEST